MTIFNSDSRYDSSEKDEFVDTIKSVLEEAMENSESRDSLTKDLASVFNKYGVDGRSSTPDFILAELIMSVLDAFAKAIKRTNEFERKSGQ